MYNDAPSNAVVVSHPAAVTYQDFFNQSEIILELEGILLDMEIFIDSSKKNIKTIKNLHDRMLKNLSDLFFQRDFSNFSILREQLDKLPDNLEDVSQHKTFFDQAIAIFEKIKPLIFDVVAQNIQKLIPDFEKDDQVHFFLKGLASGDVTNNHFGTVLGDIFLKRIFFDDQNKIISSGRFSVWSKKEKSELIHQLSRLNLVFTYLMSSLKIESNPVRENLTEGLLLWALVLSSEVRIQENPEGQSILCYTTDPVQFNKHLENFSKLLFEKPRFMNFIGGLFRETFKKSKGHALLNPSVLRQWTDDCVALSDQFETQLCNVGQISGQGFFQERSASYIFNYSIAHSFVRTLCKPENLLGLLARQEAEHQNIYRLIQGPYGTPGSQHDRPAYPICSDMSIWHTLVVSDNFCPNFIFEPETNGKNFGIFVATFPDSRYLKLFLHSSQTQHLDLMKPVALKLYEKLGPHKKKLFFTRFPDVIALDFLNRVDSGADASKATLDLSIAWFSGWIDTLSKEDLESGRLQNMVRIQMLAYLYRKVYLSPERVFQDLRSKNSSGFNEALKFESALHKTSDLPHVLPFAEKEASTINPVSHEPGRHSSSRQDSVVQTVDDSEDSSVHAAAIGNSGVNANTSTASKAPLPLSSSVSKRGMSPENHGAPNINTPSPEMPEDAIRSDVSHSIASSSLSSASIHGSTSSNQNNEDIHDTETPPPEMPGDAMRSNAPNSTPTSSRSSPSLDGSLSRSASSDQADAVVDHDQSILWKDLRTQVFSVGDTQQDENAFTSLQETIEKIQEGTWRRAFITDHLTTLQSLELVHRYGVLLKKNKETAETEMTQYIQSYNAPQWEYLRSEEPEPGASSSSSSDSSTLLNNTIAVVVDPSSKDSSRLEKPGKTQPVEPKNSSNDGASANARWLQEQGIVVGGNVYNTLCRADSGLIKKLRSAADNTTRSHIMACAVLSFACGGKITPSDTVANNPPLWLLGYAKGEDTAPLLNLQQFAQKDFVALNHLLQQAGMDFENAKKNVDAGIAAIHRQDAAPMDPPRGAGASEADNTNHHRPDQNAPSSKRRRYVRGGWIATVVFFSTTAASALLKAPLWVLATSLVLAVVSAIFSLIQTHLFFKERANQNSPGSRG